MLSLSDRGDIYLGMCGSSFIFFCLAKSFESSPWMLVSFSATTALMVWGRFLKARAGDRWDWFDEYLSLMWVVCFLGLASSVFTWSDYLPPHLP